MSKYDYIELSGPGCGDDTMATRCTDLATLQTGKLLGLKRWHSTRAR